MIFGKIQGGGGDMPTDKVNFFYMPEAKD